MEFSRYAKLLKKIIVEEAMRDLSRGNSNSDLAKFISTLRVVPVRGGLALYSEWPLEDLMGGGGIPHKIPVKLPSGGTAFKTSLSFKDGSWMAPGVRKHSFLQRSYNRFVKEYAEIEFKKEVERHNASVRNKIR